MARLHAIADSVEKPIPQDHRVCFYTGENHAPASPPARPARRKLMKSRAIVLSVASMALVGAPVMVPSANAQTMPMMMSPTPSATSYVVPVVVGVVVGALIWPLLVPAAETVVAGGGVGAAARMAAPAAAAVDVAAVA